ncbi:hypothetical protein BRD18_07230 [Halobacteriales archaeon SW_7_71_33]|nr:MAG: hypothetical protein BRD18_07230 [Halobacteriales archaeon SW_7_71_33]
MHRRDVLGAVSAVAVTGCLTGGESPPGWLVRPSQCDGAPAALLEMSDTVESPQAETVTVAYRNLTPDSRAIVDFALEHGVAAACDGEGESAFVGLREDIDASGQDEYVSENRKRPAKVYVERRGSHHPVRRLYYADVVVIG